MKRFDVLAIGLTASLAAQPAHAVEDVPAYLPGVTLGLPLGLLPAPGLYASAFASHFSFRGHNSRGDETAARIGSTPAALTFLYVTNLNIFGASYAFGVTQPIRYQTLDTPALSSDQLGVVNTVVNFGTLSWKLGNGFNVSVGHDLYLKDGSYRINRLSPTPATAPVSVGRNYWTYQPRVALTYLNNGWSFTDNMMLNINTENNYTHYQSGTFFINEATLTRRFGIFDIGVTSVYINQFEADRQYGRIVSAIPNGRGYGNKLEYASIGPMISYNPGPFAVQLYYQQNFVAKNTGGGSQIWGRVSFPLYTDRPNSPAEIESAGPR
ncbi:hypothetical protein MMMDOFMJ_4568 [Methylobacterium gnaphalii]|nr:hypothetical protein MMMDOFMJ_4568 [Methylobacterium gnaphalii]